MENKDELKEEASVIDYYTNHISIDSSLFEFIMEFGKETTSEEKTEKEIAFKVRMSPQLMKVFRNITNEAVKRYENQNGVINVPGDAAENE